jgi:hypothetical protein
LGGSGHGSRNLDWRRTRECGGAQRLFPSLPAGCRYERPTLARRAHGIPPRRYSRPAAACRASRGSVRVTVCGARAPSVGGPPRRLQPTRILRYRGQDPQWQGPGVGSSGLPRCEEDAHGLGTPCRGDMPRSVPPTAAPRSAAARLSEVPPRWRRRSPCQCSLEGPSPASVAEAGTSSRSLFRSGGGADTLNVTLGGGREALLALRPRCPQPPVHDPSRKTIENSSPTGHCLQRSRTMSTPNGKHVTYNR